MAVIRPFKAVRPRNDLAAEVAALPYDVMSSDEAREMTVGKPYSFLHIDRAEIDLPVGTDTYSDAVYEKAHSNLKKFEQDGVFVREKDPHLYIYSQTWRGRTQTGVVGCVSVDEYIDETIKKHEKTRADKEIDRIRHVDTCDANTGPIFLTYRDDTRINKIVAEYLGTEPECDFVSGEVRNRIWTLSDADASDVAEEFKRVDALYIADGHHRAASAVEVAKRRRAANPDYDGNEEFNYFLAILFPASCLEIMDYNRVIRDTNEMSIDELLGRISDDFEIIKHDGAYKPDAQHRFGMFTEDGWYELRAKDGIFDPDDPVARLDVSILQNSLIDPILDIKDPCKSYRIDFVGGIRGLGELERRVREDMKLAFSMYPTTTDDLMSIADAGLIMPPKSTWFEPKLLSGLFIHELN